MSRKLLIALAALMLAAFALAACGGDDDDGGGDTGAATTETTTDEAAGGGGGGGGTIEPVADPGGGLAYDTGALSVDSGAVTIEFDNPSQTPHDVNIETPGGETIGGTDIITDSATSATVEVPEPGDYVYYCSVPGHREAGMEEDLTVK